MARDCFVHWVDEKPTLEEIETLLREYLSGAEVIIETKGKKNDWWFISLHGNNTVHKDIHAERWFEVCAISIDKNIDVITRMQDAYTNAVAQGFAQLICHRFNAKIE